MPKQTPILIWESIEKYYQKNKKYVCENQIVLDNKKKEEFVNTFIDLYNRIRKNYMQDNVDRLDHHKQTAIIIYSIIKNEIVYSENFKNVNYGKNPKDFFSLNNEQEVFIEPERIALEFGLTFMQNSLNEKLKEIGEKPIKDYKMPKPISCNKDYYVVLIRQLFFDFHYGNISNPEVFILSLANVLFLIEYLTLKENRIDTQKLKSICKEE